MWMLATKGNAQQLEGLHGDGECDVDLFLLLLGLYYLRRLLKSMGFAFS